MIEIPNLPHISHLISVIPMQILVEKIAKLKKINPDMPRNLAKTVTVWVIRKNTNKIDLLEWRIKFFDLNTYFYSSIYLSFFLIFKLFVDKWQNYFIKIYEFK